MGTESIYLSPQKMIVSGSARKNKPTAAGTLKKNVIPNVLFTRVSYSFFSFFSRSYEVLVINVEIMDVISS